MYKRIQDLSFDENVLICVEHKFEDKDIIVAYLKRLEKKLSKKYIELNNFSSIFNGDDDFEISYLFSEDKSVDESIDKFIKYINERNENVSIELKTGSYYNNKRVLRIKLFSLTFTIHSKIRGYETYSQYDTEIQYKLTNYHDAYNKLKAKRCKKLLDKAISKASIDSETHEIEHLEFDNFKI